IIYKDFDVKNLGSLSKESIVELLLESGTWPLIRQRPYEIIANPTDTPKGIFISAFDSSPLSSDQSIFMNDYKEEFQIGLDVLYKICKAIHLNIKPEWNE